MEESAKDKSPDKAAGQHRRNGLLRGLKIGGWAIAAIVALVVLLFSSAIWYLTSERLTHLIEKYGSDYCNADIKVEHAELTFWKSFPRLRLEIKGLEVVSHALDTLPENVRRSLPADADSVMSIGYFSGSINVLKTIGGKVSLSNVIIDRPRINLLQVSETVSNFDIFPPSEPDTTKLSLPQIHINHFAITNARPFVYRSIPDSIDINLTINTTELNESSTPLYQLVIDTHVATPLLHQINHSSLQLSVDGGIGWNAETPYRLTLSDLQVGIGGIDFTVSSDIDFENIMRINTFNLDIKDLDINKLLDLMPVEYNEYISPLHTDMRLNLSARLWRPLDFTSTLGYPSMDITLKIPECDVSYQDEDFREVTADVVAHIDGERPNLSTIDIRNISMDGNALDARVKATISNIVADPRVEGHFTGSVDFSQLPSTIMSLVSGKFSGKLTADTKFRFNESDFSRNNFHKMYVEGHMNLDDFRFATHDSTTGAFANHTVLQFNSNDTYAHGNIVTDSILQLKLTADTASFFTIGINGAIKGLTAKIGAHNVKNLTDTTVITPIGASMMIDKFTYNSLEDSVKIVFSNTAGVASLRRYENDNKSPLLGLNLKVGRARVRDAHTYTAALRETSLEATAHLRGPRVRRNPSAQSDSLRKARQNRLTRDQLDSIGASQVDFAVDNSIKSLLLRWNVRGDVSASSGVARLSAIHLKNRFKDFEMMFSTDSIILRNLDYQLGGSDFKIDGKVKNLRRALTSKRHSPLRFDFNIFSDTININEVVQALSNSAMHHVTGVENSLETWGDDELHELEHPLEPADSVYGPYLIPVNIDAGFNIRANRIMYADLVLHDFVGNLFIYDGAVNLSNLTADTELGSLDLSAIYTAPTPDDMSFGMGMKLRNFRIEKLPSVVPAVDSILPMMKSLRGVVNAQIAVTSDITPDMYFDIPSLKAAMKFEGDSLVVFDSETYRKLSKWLLFKHKDHNMIDHLNVEVVVDKGVLDIYPFMLDIDRYQLGVMGTTNLNLDYNYHISVLKSPIPFKFGINIKGTPDKMKIRFGGAKFKDHMVAERDSIANTTRINLMEQMQAAFRRGLKAARLGPLNIQGKRDNAAYLNAREDAVTPADSLMMIDEGLIEVPDSVRAALEMKAHPELQAIPATPSKSKKK